MKNVELRAKPLDLLQRTCRISSSELPPDETMPLQTDWPIPSILKVQDTGSWPMLSASLVSISGVVASTINQERLRLLGRKGIAGAPRRLTNKIETSHEVNAHRVTWGF